VVDDRPLVDPGWWLFKTKQQARLVAARFWFDARTEARVGLDGDDHPVCVATPADDVSATLVALLEQEGNVQRTPFVVRVVPRDPLSRHVALVALKLRGIARPLGLGAAPAPTKKRRRK